MQVTIIKPKSGHACDLPDAASPAPAADGPAASPAVAAELADLILVFQRRLLANLSRELAPGGVSFAQFFLLATLRDAAQLLTMTEIAGRMGHTTAAATGLVDRLENLGHAERTHASDDRRKVLVRLTAPGAALVGRIKADMTHNLLAVMTHLSAEEQEFWLAIYRKLNDLCQHQTQPPDS